MAHKGSECHRLQKINKHRGKYPPVEVGVGLISWVDREPTPNPEEAMKLHLEQVEAKLDTVLKQQELILEKLTKLQEKSKAEGSKAPKKKPTKAKESQD